MRTSRSSSRILGFGFSLTVLGAGLAACMPSSPRSLPSDPTGVAPTTPPESSGAAGSPVFVPTPAQAFDAGAPSGLDAATTCVNGVAVPGGPVAKGGGGPPPQIPATVTKAATPVPPLSGGTLLALADGSAAAADPERDQVYLVDLDHSTVRTVALQAGDEPGRLVEDAAGNVHVALRRGGAIATIDTMAGTVTARQSVCSAPRGLAYEAGADLVHVACSGGELVSLPAAGGAAKRTLTLDQDLRDVVLGPNGKLLVSTFRKAEALVVEADGTVSERLQPGSGLVPSIRAMQSRTPSVAWRMVSLDSAAGSVIMLHQTGVTDEVDASSGGYAGPMGCGGIVQTGVTVLAPGAAMPPHVASGLSRVSLAIDVALSPTGDTIAMAVAGNAAIPAMPTIVTEPIGEVMAGPAIPCGAPVTSMESPPAGQVVAVSYTRSGVLLAQTREPAALWRGDTATTIDLAPDSRADTGHLIFHANAGGGLACASCHPEGGEDGRVWNFVCAGARRTQSIRGGISPTAPFHWDGSEKSFSRLMDDVFSGRMAGPPLSEDQKTALQTWVDTIPALPVKAGLDAAAVARGQTLFNDAKVGCATCHAGTLLTNNATVDVGTGQPFQVPSLRGVSWRAPFMHTGCAATLADRLSPANATCSGGDLHGVTSTLTSAQLGDLAVYLQSL
jgi:hypothetical protein